MESKLKPLIEEYIELDDQIKDTTLDLKDVKENHKKIKTEIMQLMRDGNIQNCNILGGEEQLSLVTRKTRPKPSKEIMLERIKGHCKGNMEETNSLFDLIFMPLDEEVNESLTRKRKRTTKRR